MSGQMATRRGFLTLSTALAGMLVGCAQGSGGEKSQQAATSADTSAKRESISCTEGGKHAIEVSGETKQYAAVDVTKSGDSDGDEADFYGTNAAVFATEKATLDLDDVSVTTNGAHANAVFSYGEGTTVNVRKSTIETTGNCSGGIMVTGGGTLNAEDLTVHTTGNSSATIRSDRGGGIQNVTGGSYLTEGVGSPAIYSTAEVHVKSATLESKASQGVVVEGKNSAELVDCTLTASNTKKNGDKSSWYQAVMIYQSMSGDAAQGEAGFTVQGGSITNENGDLFFVNNTVATIKLTNAKLTNNDANGVLLRAAAAGWGKEGSNGGHVTLTAAKQELAGTIVVDSVSSVNLYLTDGSTFRGAINPEGASGQEYVEVADGCTWELAADSFVTSLTCGADAIALNGHTLMVGESAYVAGTASTGSPIVVETTSSLGGQPGEPPEKPSGESGGEPPAKPDGVGNGSEPPAKPDGAGSGSEPPTKPGNDSGNTSTK